MEARFLVLLVGCLVVLMSAPAQAQYWKLSGPPEFVAVVNDRAIAVGETRTYNDGEGGVTTTLVSRTVTSAEFSTTQPRYGTHRMRFSWDAPPDVIRPGELLSVGMRWQYGSKWKRFCPQMTTLCHLDWSDQDWYTTLGYGELAGAATLKGDSGGARNPIVKVTGNDSGQLNMYWHVSCGGQWVRVNWKYRRVTGEPSGPASLNGTWHCNDKGVYEIRQQGNRVTWTGMSSDSGRTWAHDFVGTIQGNVIRGHFKDRVTGRVQSQGDLQIRIVGPHRLEMMKASGGFGGSTWTR